MGAGKIIGGIFLIVFGIIIYGSADWAKTETSYEVERCNSLLGELGQGLNEDAYQYCRDISIGNSISNVGIAVAVIFVLIGLILIIVGSVRGKRDKKNIKEDTKKSHINVNSSNQNEIRDKQIDQSTSSLQKTNKPIIENITNENKNNNDYISRLEKLGEMKKNEIITEEEFNILKANILKKFDTISLDNAKSDPLVTNSNLKETSKTIEKQKKIRRYTSEGKPIYE